MTREQKMYLLGDSYAILHHSFSGNFAVLTDGTLYMLTGWLEKSNTWVTIATSDDFGFVMGNILNSLIQNWKRYYILREKLQKPLQCSL